MASLGKILKVAVILYLAIVGGLYMAQRDIIYFPAATKPNINAASIGGFEEINVATKDGLSLYGWYLPPSNPVNPTIVFFHGNASNILWHSERAKPYVDLGYGVLMAEYRGYGGNEGDPSEQGLYDDARAYIDWLQAQDNFSGIILYGESLGTGIAVQMASEYTAQAVILEAPYTSFVDVAKRQYWFVPVGFLMRDRFDSLSKIADINAPLVIVTGSNDKVIPMQYSQRLFDAAMEPKTLVVMDGAGHNDFGSLGVENHIIPVLQNLEKHK